MKIKKNVLKPVFVDDMGRMKSKSFDIGDERILTIIENRFRGGLDISILPAYTFSKDVLSGVHSEDPILTIDKAKDLILTNAPYGYFRTDNVGEFPTEEDESINVDFYGEIYLSKDNITIVESYQPLSTKEEHLISEFFKEEFGHDFSYQGERLIHLAYTENDDGNPIEVVLDLKGKFIQKQLFLLGKETIVEYSNHYTDNLEEVILSLSFDELVMMDYED